MSHLGAKKYSNRGITPGWDKAGQDQGGVQGPGPTALQGHAAAGTLVQLNPSLLRTGTLCRSPEAACAQLGPLHWGSTGTGWQSSLFEATVVPSACHGLGCLGEKGSCLGSWGPRQSPRGRRRCSPAPGAGRGAAPRSPAPIGKLQVPSRAMGRAVSAGLYAASTATTSSTQPGLRVPLGRAAHHPGEAAQGSAPTLKAERGGGLAGDPGPGSALGPGPGCPGGQGRAGMGREVPGLGRAGSRAGDDVWADVSDRTR